MPKPTGANILAELDRLTTRVKAGDTVFILYSGHGIEMDRVSYLLPWDTDARSDQTLKASALSTAEITARLQKVPASDADPGIRHVPQQPAPWGPSPDPRQYP